EEGSIHHASATRDWLTSSCAIGAPTTDRHDAAWRIGDLARLRASLGNAGQGLDRGLPGQPARRAPGDSRDARALPAARDPRDLGHRRPADVRRQAVDAGVPAAGAPAPRLFECCAVALPGARLHRPRRGQRSIPLRAVAGAPDRRDAAPGNWHPYLLALLLPGG